MTGILSILNVGDGDTKLSFDPKKPKERERTCKIVTDMIRSGYVLLVEVGQDEKGPLYRRVQKFDPETAEYIVAGDPPEEKIHEPKIPPRRKGPQSRTSQRRISAQKANAVAIPKTAGG